MTFHHFSAKWALMVVAIVLSACAIAQASPAAAATKPAIGPTALYGSSEFRAASAVVWGATAVAICVSGKCVKAFKQRAGLWAAPASGLPMLRRGQRRQVVVFAVNATGQFAYATTHPVVR